MEEEGRYFDLQAMSGAEILETRQAARESDRVTNPIYYTAIEVDPNKMYMASIIWEDFTALTSMYVEEIIYEIKDED